MFDSSRLNKIADGLYPIFKIAMGLGLLFFLLYRVPFQQLLRTITRLNSFFILGALLFSSGSMLTSIFKLRLIFNTTNFQPAISQIASAYYVGHFFNNFIPTSIGGDLVKINQLLKDNDNDLLTVSSAIAAERFSGIIVLLSIGLLTTVFLPGFYPNLGIGVISTGKFWGLLAAGGAGLTVLFTFLGRKRNEKQPESEWRKTLHKILHFEGLTLKKTLIILGVSIFFHFIRGLVFVLTARGAGIYLNYWTALALLPLIALVSFLPFSLGSLGLREGVITFGLHGVGVPLEKGLAIALIYRGYSLFHSFVGGVIYMLPDNKSEQT